MKLHSFLVNNEATLFKLNIELQSSSLFSLITKSKTTHRFSDILYMNIVTTLSFKHLKPLHFNTTPTNLLHKHAQINKSHHHYQQNHHFTSLQCGSLFQTLTNTKFLEQGQQLHAHTITTGTILNNTYLSTKVAAFYANCGQMRPAQVVFDRIVSKNSFLWNFMIRGFACNGFSAKAVAFYRDMLRFGLKADNFTYPFVVKACGELLDVEIGRRVHCEVVVNGFESDLYVGNSVLAMYLKFGDMRLAQLLFDRMPSRDLTSWNTVIAGYVKNSSAVEALWMFCLMRECWLVFDGTTLLSVLSACGELGALKQGKEIHGYIIRNGNALRNGFLENCLIEMYCSCKSVADAGRLFDKMERRDVVSWNSLIDGYFGNGDVVESLSTFCRMLLEGSVQPDQVTLVTLLSACDDVAALPFGMNVHAFLVKKGFCVTVMVGTALINMYAKCGSLACAVHVFHEMPLKNLVSWSAMISAYGVHGRGEEAVSLFGKMIEDNIIPDEAVMTSVLSACGHAGMVVEGREIFQKITKDYNLKPAQTHYSCFVDLLGRAGHVYEAYEVIKNMDIKPTSDIWAALLSACRLHQCVELAEICAQKIFDMSEKHVGSYIGLSNVYASKKRWDDAERVRTIVKMEGLVKQPGYSSLS